MSLSPSYYAPAPWQAPLSSALLVSALAGTKAQPITSVVPAVSVVPEKGGLFPHGTILEAVCCQAASMTVAPLL